MARQDLRLLVSTLLLAAMVVTVLTGLVADALDLNSFVYHRYPAYLSAGLLAAHLLLNGRIVQSQWATRLRALRVRREVAGRTSESGPSTGDQGLPAGTAMRRRELLLAGAGGATGLLVGWLTSPRPWLSGPLGGDLGELYHDWSKPSYAGLLASVFGRVGPPAGRRRRGDVSLPRDFSDRGLSLEETIDRRRSIRSYSAKPMALLQLSRLLHRAAGITDPANGYRAAPSAGALYPLELYVVANNVGQLPQGIYRYDCEGHSLETVRAGDHRRSLLVASLGQDMVLHASAVLVLAAVFQRTRWKYRERAYRYVLMECGHVAQNVYLAATSMGLAACAIGAFLDDELNALLALDGKEEAALYILTVGAP